MKQLTEDGLIPPSRISPSRSHSPISEMGKSRSPARGRVSGQPSVDELEEGTCKLNPKVEQRIIEMTQEVCEYFFIKQELLSRICKRRGILF